MEIFNGIYILPDQCMNERWIWFLLSVNCCTIRLRLGGDDKICWTPSGRQKFEVRSFYHVLSIPVNSQFPLKSIWRGKAPSRGILCVDNDIRKNLNFG
jgi:hypothetical protein